MRNVPDERDVTYIDPKSGVQSKTVAPAKKAVKN
jgi:hypothetical protein